MWQTIVNFLFNQTPLLYWTQSLWRDEAFSVWISQGTLTQAIERTSGDFNPPFYYLLLNLWMKLFGNSEVALRGMSLVIFLAFLIVVYYFGKSLFKSDRAAIFTTIFMAINPMLLYFAFELRMYSLLVLFATLSMYFLHTKNWKWYIVASTLGMYTQPFMAFVILSQCVYMLITKQLVQLIKNGIVIGLLYLPWVPTLLTQFRASGPMWMYPIDLNLILSVLGNLFFGYEGTPGNLWQIMQIASLIFILAAIFAWKNSKSKSNINLLLCWVLVPCVSVLAISLLKPIYVHRYLIFVSVGLVFLLSASLLSLKQKAWGYRLFGIIILLTFVSNFLISSFHHKVNLQQTFAQVKLQLKPTDVVYAATPLVYYESLYYTPKTTQVFLYNPDSVQPPRYVGSVGMPPETWVSTYPMLPNRAFIVGENGDYQIRYYPVSNL